MRYIDLTSPEDNEPTYNAFQTFVGLVSITSVVGILAFGTLSLVSAL